MTTEQAAPAAPAVHPNTVRAVMKKSGLTEARSWRSGMIRGYTCWWAGWRIATPRNGEPVKVFHQCEGAYDSKTAQAHATQYHKALEGTFVCFVNGRHEVVIAGRKEQVK